MNDADTISIVSSFFCLLKYLCGYLLSQCDKLLNRATGSVMQVLCKESACRSV